MNKPKKTILVFILVLLILAAIGVFANVALVNNRSVDIAKEQEEFSVQETDAPSVPTPVPTPEVYEVTLMSVGDNLIHTSVYNSALQADGTYNFDKQFENLRDQIEGADISVINQETIFIDDRDSISGYPTFGTPIEMTDALANAGFNVVLHATNHVMDKGIKGISDTISIWKNYFPGMIYLGINSSQEEADELCIINKNNIKIAMFNYTYGTNGIQIPQDKPYLVNTLYDRNKIIDDLDRAEREADVTVCFVHIGEEYHHQPTEYQKEYIKTMIDYGADLVICAHPHVLEPYEMVTTDLNNTGLVYYSLGNFISGQNETPRLLGGMADVTIRKTVENGKTTIDFPKYMLTALVTHQEQGNFTVYRLHDYDDSLAKKNKMHSLDPGFSCDNLWKLYSKILNWEA